MPADGDRAAMVERRQQMACTPYPAVAIQLGPTSPPIHPSIWAPPTHLYGLLVGAVLVSLLLNGRLQLYIRLATAGGPRVGGGISFSNLYS